MTTITEADVESAALDWLSALGWQVAHGPDIAPDTPHAERDHYGQVVLERRLRDALARLNSTLPASALEDAFRKLTRPQGSTLEARNRAFHRMLVNGVEIEYLDSDGRVRGDQVRVIDFDNAASNDWLAVNQFTMACWYRKLSTGESSPPGMMELSLGLSEAEPYTLQLSGSRHHHHQRNRR